VSGVLPKRSLGQHFLVDPNLLGVIGRLADLAQLDVVLEVGPGEGALTRFLAERVSFVHALEIDRRLEGTLADVAARTNVDIVWADALRFDLRDLAPAPSKLVANLPYNVATPVVMETMFSVPSLDSWCVMVQREIADRLFAAPSTRAYGAVSVLVQLATRRTGFHPVARTVFRPVPNVESALIAFSRVPFPGDAASIRRLVEAAFAHRRKTLANAVALAGLHSRERAVAALGAIGCAGNVRAEALAPGDFVALEQALR
jgi:16S rRNA (adenine1518-N6/adenine1519-N6)-dimethyltransferase